LKTLRLPDRQPEQLAVEAFITPKYPGQKRPAREKTRFNIVSKIHGKVISFLLLCYWSIFS
jgi:hypothetical protein